MAKNKTRKRILAARPAKDSAAFDKAYPQPVALLRDPASRVVVAPLGDDRGTGRSAAKARPLDSGKNPVEDGQIGGLGPDYVAENGRPRRVTRRKDILDVMLDNGTIDNETWRGGKDLQVVFDWMTDSPIGTVNFDRVGGGGGADHTLHFARRAAARRAYEEAVEALGGPSSRTVVAVRGVVLIGKSYDDMVRDHSHPKHYWRGMVLAGLENLRKNWARSPWWQG
jgi:hypothetical protein